MLDRRYVAANVDEIERIIQARRSRVVDVPRFALLEEQRRAAEQDFQDLRAAMGRHAREVRGPEGAPAAREMRERERSLRADIQRLTAEADELLRAVPNLLHPSVPLGDESDSREIARGATEVPVFDHPVKDHVDLGTDLGILDLEAGSRVAGAGFYFLQGDGAMLELALQAYTLKRLVAEGFLPQVVPELAKDHVLAGTGYAPRGDESNTYSIEGDDLNLIATAEIVLCGRYAGQVLREQDLPLRLCGVSHCFRTERAYGKATRGLFRVHQFLKVEMVVLCTPEQSEAEHANLLRIEREIFDDLGVPYRVVDIASGDLGAPAYRKFDIEAWMPGRGEGGAFSEVTSASNCTDYQSRRLDIKYATPDGRRSFVHTLNGTGMAVGRAMIAILENNQLPDGRVRVPSALQPFLGTDVISPRG